MDGDMQTMNQAQIPETVWDIIYLTACALHERRPDRERTARMDFRAVYRMSKFHSMEALVFMALEGEEELSGMGEPLAGEWKQAKEKAIRKNILLDAGRRQILGELESAEIWYLPLKGSVLQALYPKYGMRQMADNDILYDVERRGDVFAIMKQCGYENRGEGSCFHHDAFEKLPVYHFEMHKSLFEKKENPEWYQYYQNVKDRLCREDGARFGYYFTDEDFYVYMIAHAYVHYRHNGCGLRTLTDCYVYIWKKGTVLDWNYIAEQLSVLKIADFERKLRLLSSKLFGKCEPCRRSDLNEEEREMLQFLAESGTYGTSKNYVVKKMKQYGIQRTGITFAGRLRYLRNRLFPNMEWFRENEPFYASHKLLIPFFLVWRIIRHLLFHREWLGRELRTLWKFRYKETKIIDNEYKQKNYH